MVNNSQLEVFIVIVIIFYLAFITFGRGVCRVPTRNIGGVWGVSAWNEGPSCSSYGWQK